VFNTGLFDTIVPDDRSLRAISAVANIRNEPPVMNIRDEPSKQTW
jgi:hypothetical protein